jgi:hypothetical protein
MRNRFAALVVTLSCVTSACTDSAVRPSTSTSTSTSTSVAPLANGGDAAVVPTTVRVGGTFTITPAAEIQPICTRTAVVLHRNAGALVAIGYLNPGGGWQSLGKGAPPATFAACLAPRSAAAVVYDVPSQLTPGEYMICMETSVPGGPVAAPVGPSCGAFTIVA